jgi:tRNA (cmo5U34)-methyltransferase
VESMSYDVKRKFDEVAQEYDQQRRQLIPCFDDFYGVAASLVKAPSESPKILDLGAGTGLFTAFVKHKYPKAQFTLIDLSGSMIDKARERFGETENMTYIVDDYTKHAYTDTYDIVISSLSIHHLPHSSKRELFATVHRLLEDRGIFVNADQSAGNTPYLDSIYKREWEKSVTQSGLSAQAINASKERRQASKNRIVFTGILNLLCSMPEKRLNDATSLVW